jgi:hypothetical protein
MARVTRLELAASGVTGRRSNQLSYTRIVCGAVYIRGGSVWQGLFCKKKTPGKFTCATAQSGPDLRVFSQPYSGDQLCSCRRKKCQKQKKRRRKSRRLFCTSFPIREGMARVTRLELAASGVTGRRSNQLSYTRMVRGAVFSSRIQVAQAVFDPEIQFSKSFLCR